MIEFEFQGALHRNSQQMHDAIAEEWLSAGGSNARGEMRELLRLTDEQLTFGAIEGFGLHIIAGFDRRELFSAFLRLREQFDERFERRSFARDEAGRANETPQFGEGDRAQAFRCESAGCAEIDERAFYGFPRGVLREIGAEDDFKGRLSRPPKLRAIGSHQNIVHAAQAHGRSVRTAGVHGCH